MHQPADGRVETVSRYGLQKELLLRRSYANMDASSHPFAYSQQQLYVVDTYSI